MAECTHIDLRKARDAADMPRWKLGGMIGVSESTIERWETGESVPTPEDVDRFAEAVQDPTLWHRWMVSTHDSYRKRYLHVMNLALPVAILRSKHEMQDVLALQDAVERDAISGAIDDPALKDHYKKEIDEAIAALRDVREGLGND